MITDEKEGKDAVRWLIVAGGLACVLSYAIYRVDIWQEGAPARDREHNAKLGELRSAQSSLPSRVTDERQLVGLKEMNASSKTAPVPESPASEGHGEGHGSAEHGTTEHSGH